MTFNKRINITLSIFTIMTIIATYGIIENSSIIFVRLISTILNLISFIASIIVISFCKWGLNITKQMKVNSFLYFCFIISCFSYFVFYSYIGLKDILKMINIM